eukprot:m.225744 g.225744  ORF g.225744 m.225744 type:complete len:343 (+) comp11313_c0_seq1:783-1811(+)
MIETEWIERADCRRLVVVHLILVTGPRAVIIVIIHGIALHAVLVGLPIVIGGCAKAQRIDVIAAFALLGIHGIFVEGIQRLLQRIVVASRAGACNLREHEVEPPGELQQALENGHTSIDQAIETADDRSEIRDAHEERCMHDQQRARPDDQLQTAVGLRLELPDDGGQQLDHILRRQTRDRGAHHRLAGDVQALFQKRIIAAVQRLHQHLCQRRGLGDLAASRGHRGGRGDTHGADLVLDRRLALAAGRGLGQAQDGCGRGSRRSRSSHRTGLLGGEHAVPGLADKRDVAQIIAITRGIFHGLEHRQHRCPPCEGDLRARCGRIERGGEQWDCRRVGRRNRN